MGWDGVCGILILTNFSHDSFTFFFCLFLQFCLQCRNKASEIADCHQEVQMLACCCNVWTNGIYWKREEVKVIVEVSKNYHCVTVITSVNDVMKRCSFLNNVIKSVLKLSEMHTFKYEEYLIAPSDVVKAHSLLVKDCTLYNITDVAQSLLAKCNVSDDNDTKSVGIEQIVGHYDPFLCIAPSVTKALFSAELPLREDHHQNVVNRCSCFTSTLFSSSHMSVEERCSQLSVFAGL